MSTPDFFRARLDAMVDHRHPLVVLADRLPWAQIAPVLKPYFARNALPQGQVLTQDLMGAHPVECGSGGISHAGRPRRFGSSSA